MRDLNLLKIESRPLRGKPWEYLFYLDLIGDVSDERLKKAIGHLEEVADFLINHQMGLRWRIVAEQYHDIKSSRGGFQFAAE